MILNLLSFWKVLTSTVLNLPRVSDISWRWSVILTLISRIINIETIKVLIPCENNMISTLFLTFSKTGF